MLTSLRMVALACMSVLSIGAAYAADPMVNESARDIPIAYDVDVVVVGGGTGAVSAAVAAAESGAEVFLAAPHPYLGDDMTATLRLWLEDGEVPTSPLAVRIFADAVTGSEQPDPNRLPFTYTDGPCGRRQARRHPRAQPADRRPMARRFDAERAIRRRREHRGRPGPGAGDRESAGQDLPSRLDRRWIQDRPASRC